MRRVGNLLCRKRQAAFSALTDCIVVVSYGDEQ